MLARHCSVTLVSKALSLLPNSSRSAQALLLLNKPCTGVADQADYVRSPPSSHGASRLEDSTCQLPISPSPPLLTHPPSSSSTLPSYSPTNPVACNTRPPRPPPPLSPLLRPSPLPLPALLTPPIQQPFLYASHRGFLEAQRFLHEAFQSHLRALISCHALLLSRHSDPSRRITKPLRTLTRHLAALLALLLPSLNRLARTAVEASAVAKDLRNREEGREKRLGRLLERFEVGRKRWEGVEQWGEAYRAWLDGAKKELWSALVVPSRSC